MVALGEAVCFDAHALAWNLVNGPHDAHVAFNADRAACEACVLEACLAACQTGYDESPAWDHDEDTGTE